MSTSAPENEAIPSHQSTVLCKLLDHHVLKMIRYAWWPPQHDIDTYHIQPTEVFSLTDGPIVLYMDDGVIVGFGAQSGLASMTVWQEPPGITRDRFATDHELHPIEANDSCFSNALCRGVVGKKIVKVMILKRLPKSAILACCPCESGIVLRFEYQQELFIGYGLRNDTDELVAIPRDQLHPGVQQELEEISIS